MIDWGDVAAVLIGVFTIALWLIIWEILKWAVKKVFRRGS